MQKKEDSINPKEGHSATGGIKSNEREQKMSILLSMMTSGFSWTNLAAHNEFRLMRFHLQWLRFQQLG